MDRGDKVRVVIEGEVSRKMGNQAIHIKGYGKIPISAESSYGATVKIEKVSSSKN